MLIKINPNLIMKTNLLLKYYRMYAHHISLCYISLRYLAIKNLLNSTRGT